MIAAITMRPRARGRSLSAVSLLHSDPDGRVATAATARWAMEAWVAYGHAPQAVSIGQLASGWYAAAVTAKMATWRTARGPIAIANLELARIRWEWPAPFTLRTHEGKELCLLTTSPKAIREELHAATLDGLARSMLPLNTVADGSGARVLYEPVMRKLASRRMSPQEKRDRAEPLRRRRLDADAAQGRGVRYRRNMPYVRQRNRRR